MQDAYNEQIIKHIHAIKATLPADYPLQTRVEREDDFFYIVICVPIADFNRRTVEDRLDIAIKLEQLRQLISESGVGCVIEKD